MLKAIIFDFDGVILESVDVKTYAFSQLFAKYPSDKVAAIKRYHLDNGGISRVIKIEHVYKNILNESLSKKKLDELCVRFSELAMQKVMDSPFVEGAEELLNACLGKYMMFVASGTPQDEMRDIIQQCGLKKYFKEVYGSPTSKSQIIEEILSENHLKTNELIFIGDSKNDLKAAKDHDIHFIARYYPQEKDADWLTDRAVKAKFPDMMPVLSYLKNYDQKFIKK